MSDAYVMPEYLPRTRDEYTRLMEVCYGKISNPLIHYMEFQRETAKRSSHPILNAACGGDIAGLADFGALNMDLHDRQEFSAGKEASARNFVKGSILDIPYPDGAFQTVVVGEFLEHCQYEVAARAMRECRRVMADDGRMIVTVPLDPRTLEEQEWYGRLMDPDVPVTGGAYDNGIAERHQTYWSLFPLQRLLRDVCLEDAQPRQLLLYAFTTPVVGWGMVLRKTAK